MLSKAIQSIEKEIASLKDQTAREIKDIYAYLSRTNAKTKLRPRIKMNAGSAAFSIIWHRLIFFNHNNHRSIFKEIRKGPSSLVPKSRLLAYCRTCDSWESEYIWEKEVEFGRVRKKMSLLSLALKLLKQYYALELRVEQDNKSPMSVPVVTFMAMEDVIKTMTGALESLKDRTVQEVADLRAHLTEAGQMSLRPRIELNKRSGAFSVEWVKQNGCDPKKGLSREQRYVMRKSRLLAQCGGCENLEREYIWEKEVEFGRVRKQVDLMGQALPALKKYVMEEAIEGEKSG